MFMLCIAQIGPGLVLVPAAIWTYWSGDTVWGTVLLMWSLIVGTFDDFMRPILIKRGADLPLLLIFIGVVGGLLAFARRAGGCLYPATGMGVRGTPLTG